MAKITGISGMIQGKVGPNVYRVSRGVQVVSQYNPNPNNPNSPGQIKQREIFGSAVKIAKAFYDDSVAGPLFQSVAYKQRNALISKILTPPVRTLQMSGTSVWSVALDEVKETWVPGFPEIDIDAEITEDDLTVNVSPISDGTQPTITGVMVIKISRPVPGNTYDDNFLLGLPNEAVAQGIIGMLDSPAAPGNTEKVEIPLEDFAYPSPLGADYVMPTIDNQSNAASQSFKCWYVIPFSTQYLGSGLRMEMDGVLYTFGKCQILWQAPSAE